MEIDYNIQVSEVMSFPVITATKDKTVYDIANIMAENDIGAVVIVENNNPIGIITERDILKRVVAKNLRPKDVLVEEVMSKKLVTVSPEASINDAAKLMAKHKIKRLPVVKEGKLVGIITESDIIKVSPEIINLLAEYASIKEKPTLYETEEEYIEGICESCGAQGRVKYYQGKYLCEDCLEEYKK
ncbi:putative signal transduction protein [Methanocaldococcus villosus KIN24-T80]|uniref:Putative signal transduction protein n=1 Tax=Methanocaldococcus villosus KIN24-T80 TaxID=1069083 RepID=N6VRB9_9EURY|nr:CBS domain-containing protein [Methanocaldococcus villosus]ENN96445.1 putative signal transduction protein [Methanocaldococcus villosus KIN24-T80]